ncbi:ATP-binding protein [Streptacidiphilus neutrinimicus]|uniref:ATP-binding protein n=1 Tax=Streptacidiphilus neutrinimicus TaxID=105420 RepID=UPI0007C752C0|nr:ATP-binding protein [Streptacidiphilus neutrinimicus]
MWFTPYPKAVALARHQSRRALTDIGVPPATIDDIELIVSELLTNAIRHCDTKHLVHVALLSDDQALIVEVSDPSREKQPRPVIAAAEDEGGRGLTLVRMLATEVGFRDRNPVGKTVWATIPTGDEAC